MALGWTVGIDVGGTFTDAIAEHRDGRTRIAKVASTPKDPSIALVDAFDELLREGVDAPDVGLVFHGTTVATTAMLTGRTSRVVLLTTERARRPRRPDRGSRACFRTRRGRRAAHVRRDRPRCRRGRRARPGRDRD